MRAKRELTALVAILGAAPFALGQGDSDPFYGTWTLDPQQSHYTHESPPDRMTVVIAPERDGLSYRSEVHYSDGRTLAVRYVAHFDGVPVLVVGTTGLLAPIALSRTDAATIDAVYRMGIKKVAWSHWSLNAERKQLQVVTTSLTPQGDEICNVVVLNRE